MVEARFLQRVNRFVAEAVLVDGTHTLAHLPNSGRLSGCAIVGARCWLAPTEDGKRLPFRLELMEAPGGILVGVNTQRSNSLALQALCSGLVTLPGLESPFTVERERSPHPGLRIDLLLTDRSGSYWVEVKNITLVEDGVGLFPDAVTARGARHLAALAEVARAGVRAAVLYVVQRRDAVAVRAAAEVDPAYAAAASAAAAAGVAFAAVSVEVTLDSLVPHSQIPVLMAP